MGAEDQVFCPDCGSPVGGDEKFCWHCGHPLAEHRADLAPATPDDAATTPMPAPLTAAPAPAPTPAPTQPPRRTGVWLGVVLVLVLLVGAAAFLALRDTGPSVQERRAAAQAAERAARARAAAAARRKADRCEATMEPLLRELRELDSRLDIGLNYAEYSDKVADAKVSYDRVTADLGDDQRCITAVGVPAENALNDYTKAVRIWDDCFDSYSCSNDEIDPELQRYWSRASDAIAESEAGLAALRRPVAAGGEAT